MIGGYKDHTNMSYAGISVREAMEKLNNLNGGWYLPYIQRQYVWGERSKSEGYVCLLLDSLIKRYPIGGLVLWETMKPVSYRTFLDDFEPGKFAKQVEEGRRGAHKFLVYDGQQRLQTLRSVLYHTFNGRVLHFDLLFDATKEDSDETGFLFRDKDAPPDPRYVKLTELVSTLCDPSRKVELEYRLLKTLRQAQPIDMPTEMLIRTNLAALWDIFVDTNVKSIAYFSVTTPARFGRMAMNFAQLAGLNVGEWNSASAPAIARIALGSAELIPLVQDRGSRGMTSRRFNRHGHLRH